MSIRHRPLLAITVLFFFKVAVAQDETGYMALTNAGYVSVTTSVQARSNDETEKVEVYRDKLIIEDTNSMEDESDVSSSSEHGN